MSKIVCDICGTSYDDSNGGCPVCGWGQTGELPTEDVDFDTDFLDTIQEDEAHAVPAESPKAAKAAAVAAASAKSRRSAKPEPKKPVDEDEDDDEDDNDEEEEESGSNAFLVIILVLLILALLAVSAYIGWTKILKPKQMGNENNAPKETITAQVVDPTVTTASGVVDVTEENAGPTVPCTNIALSGNVDTLFIGQYWRLMAKATPENTTDKIVYASSNDSVISIDEYGRVTAVGAGEAVITITCGSQHLETTVVVKSSETDVATTATTPTASAPAEGTSGTIPANNNNTSTNTNVAKPSGSFALGKHDITFFKLGTYFTMPIEGGITADDVKWSTSDSSVANVYNGVITCTGRGVCVVTAEYNGQTEQCVVRCKY